MHEQYIFLYFTGSIYLRLTSFTLLFDIVVLFVLYYRPPWYISGLYSMRHNLRVGGASPVFRNMQRFSSYKQQKLCGALYTPTSLNFLLVICYILFDVLYVFDTSLYVYKYYVELAFYSNALNDKHILSIIDCQMPCP